MSVRSCRANADAMASSVLVLAFCLLSCPGCRSESKCGDLWDSPTIKGTRALVVIPAGELKILRVDGQNVRPYQISPTHGQREYLIPAGEHTITAVFRFAAPVSNGLLGEVRGHPLRLKHFFHAGREYAALYRIHPYERPEARWFLEAVAMTLFTSMEIVDLAQAEAATADDVESEVRRWPATHHGDLNETLATILAQQADIKLRGTNAPEQR